MGLSLRIACAFALPLVFAACESPASFSDAHDIGVAAQQLESTAHEAAWLSQQLRSRDVSTGMAWVHQQALAQDCAKTLASLSRPVPPPLQARHDEVAQLAAQLQSRVTRIAPAAAQPDALEALRAGFDALAKAAHPIAGLA